MKKIIIAVLASAFIISMGACGNSGTSSTASNKLVASSQSSSSSSGSVFTDSVGSEASGALPSPEDAGALEISYIEELSVLLPSISRIQEAQDTAMTDPEEANAALDSLKEEFTKLGALQAPPRYYEAQQKISECSVALIEMIDYSQEILLLSEEEATPEKAQEAIEKMELLSNTAAEAMEAATTLIWGENGEPTSEADEADSSSDAE